MLRQTIGLLSGLFLPLLGLGKTALAQGVRRRLCCPKDRVCQVLGTTQIICCPEGTVCKDGKCVCPPNTQPCVSPAGQTVCCPANTACIQGGCCPKERICQVLGTTQRFCCPEGTVCQ